MIRMWKIAHAAPMRMWPTIETWLAIVKPAQLAPSSAISMKTSSPAYMLPNSRIASEMGLERISTRFRKKFGIHSSGFEPNGAVNSSCAKPPAPLALIEK